MKARDILAIALVAALALAGYLGYEWQRSREELSLKSDEFASSTAELSAKLDAAANENKQLAEALDTEQRRNEEFEQQIDDISGTVGRLDKLSRTDPELLAKYSKVYFLNENFVPSDLVQIPTEWTYGGQEEYFHAKIWPDLLKLLDSAKDDAIDLEIISGYRSFGKQAVLKAAYKVSYGAGANAFSADQGYSEHQLGSTVDFTTASLGGNFSAFDGTDGYEWLVENAYKFGFVLSYPPDNAYYQYEPWHWRYVGRGLARELNEEGKYFYDLDQRTIDEYLVEFFD